MFSHNFYKVIFFIILCPMQRLLQVHNVDCTLKELQYSFLFICLFVCSSSAGFLAPTLAKQQFHLCPLDVSIHQFQQRHGAENPV